MYRRFYVGVILVILASFGLGFGLSQDANHQPLVNSNEFVLLSFVVEDSSKIFTIATARDESYIVHRFGEDDNIEFEYPRKTEDSWEQFTYSHYSRAVGNANALLDLNYLEFTVGSRKYFVYDSFSEEFIKSFIGVTIINLVNGDESNFLAASQEKIGNLSRLQLSPKVKSQSALVAQVPSTPGRTIELEGASDNNAALVALEEDILTVEAEVTNKVNSAEQSLERVIDAFDQLRRDTTDFRDIAYWRVEDEVSLENVRRQVSSIVSNQEPVQQLITQFELANAEESKARYLIDIEAYSESMSVLGDELELLETAAINSFNESRAIYNR